MTFKALLAAKTGKEISTRVVEWSPLWGQRSNSYNRRPLRKRVFVINLTK